jgi:hypothetical protein
VIAKALVALREKEGSSLADDNGHYDDAVREMLNFVEKTALLCRASLLSN